MNKAQKIVKALRKAADAYEDLPESAKRNYSEHSFLIIPSVSALSLRREADRIESVIEDLKTLLDD